MNLSEDLKAAIALLNANGLVVNKRRNHGDAERILAMKREGAPLAEISQELRLGAVTVARIYRDYVGEIGPDGSTRMPVKRKKPIRKARPDPPVLCEKCGKPLGCVGHYIPESRLGEPAFWTCDYDPPKK